MIKDDRFQHQNLLIKIWRCRLYYKLPFLFLTAWWWKISHPKEPTKLNNKTIWSICRSIVESDMKWYYTTEEVFGCSLQELLDNIEKEDNKEEIKDI